MKEQNLRRLNANRERDDDVAHIILGWDSRPGKKSSPKPLSARQKMLAAKEAYKPGQASANAVVTVSVHESRSQTQITVQWPGLTPRQIIDRAITALEAERADLINCPAHKEDNASASIETARQKGEGK